MRKTNDELDAAIGDQQALIGGDAGKVDIRRGHVTAAHGQLVENRAAAIRALEGQKELTTVRLRAGI